MHLLIDGDVLVYESAFAAQKTRYRVDKVGTTFENAKAWEDYLKGMPSWETKVEAMGKRDALKALKELFPAERVVECLDLKLMHKIAENKLRDIVNEVKADSYSIVLSGSDNFRDDVATIQPYKGNRQSEKPIYFEDSRAWFESHQCAVVSEGMEADDLMGIWMTRGKGDCIASIDKDLRMIPGAHYEWHKGLKFRVNRDKALEWFHRQMLMGDTADNIPGISGLGPVKAEEALAGLDANGRCSVIEGLYEEQYNGTDHQPRHALNECARLLWILRSPEQMEDGNLWFNLKKGN